jgi:hypothetical protein
MSDHIPTENNVPHEYGPSRVGHGEAQCRWCLGTNRENAIISPNHCEVRAERGQKASPSSKPVDNPWRIFIENVIAGSNYFRASEYYKLLSDLDRLYALEQRPAPETTPQAPIAHVTVVEDYGGYRYRWSMYAPGLPPGTHDLYCEPPAPGGQKVPHPCFAPETNADLLQAAWLKYGRHSHDCQRYGEHQCTCGFVETCIALRSPEKTTAVPEYESAGWQYCFPSLWGGVVWRDSASSYNGSNYTASREIFVKRADLSRGAVPAEEQCIHRVPLSSDCMQCGHSLPRMLPKKARPAPDVGAEPK